MKEQESIIYKIISLINHVKKILLVYFRFALLVANVFVQRGHLARLFSHICPTPWVPFAVTTFNCCAGIMITASHNPKEDNGYKVYWANGAQVFKKRFEIQSSFCLLKGICFCFKR